jgi:hypothetical protein
VRVSRFLLVVVAAVAVLFALAPADGAGALAPSPETGAQERRVASLEDMAATLVREIGAVTEARAGAWLQPGADDLAGVASLTGRLGRLEARRHAVEEELKALRLELEEPPVPSGLEASGVERWRSLVAEYFPAGRVEEALSIMDCESGGDPTARNPRSGAAGLYQFLPRTWNHASAQTGVGHLSVDDPEANIAAAAWLTEYSVSRGNRAWSHWTCRP